MKVYEQADGEKASIFSSSFLSNLMYMWTHLLRERISNTWLSLLSLGNVRYIASVYRSLCKIRSNHWIHKTLHQKALKNHSNSLPRSVVIAFIFSPATLSAIQFAAVFLIDQDNEVFLFTVLCFHQQLIVWWQISWVQTRLKAVNDLDFNRISSMLLITSFSWVNSWRFWVNVTPNNAMHQW